MTALAERLGWWLIDRVRRSEDRRFRRFGLEVDAEMDRRHSDWRELRDEVVEELNGAWFRWVPDDAIGSVERTADALDEALAWVRWNAEMERRWAAKQPPSWATPVKRHRWSPPEGPRLEDGSFLSGYPAQRDRVLWGVL